MRKFLMAAAALAIAAPAIAEQPQQQIPTVQGDIAPAPLPDPRDQEIQNSLPDPRELEAMGDVAVRAMDAILDTPVGPLREAIEGRKLSRREREETLGDQARRDDPYFRERMRDQMSVAAIAVSALAEQMAVLTPVLRQTLEDVERRVEDATRGLPSREYGRW